MSIYNQNNCPNYDCDGKIKIKYQSVKLDLYNINFNCTTDTYIKPTILECTKCEIIFSELINQLNENQFENNYKEVEDKKYISQIQYKKIYFENLVKKISKDVNNEMNVLEIGSYYGVLGSILNKKFKNYSGLELSTHGSNYSKNIFGLNIYNETVEQHSQREKKYDLIIMADVIEHFSNPFKVFKIINKLLKKDGKLILTTFNMDSYYSKITRKNYHWIIPFHLVYFTNNTLQKLGEKINLKLFKIENDPRFVSVGYLLEKLELIFPKLNFLFNLFNKIKFIKKFTIRVNLRDLNIYYFKKNNEN